MIYSGLMMQKSLFLLDCISGSQAYNLSLPGSDVDKKGVFVLPQSELFGFELTDQVNNESNDEVYYEIRRFLDLLTKNNPNILELLNTPPCCVLYRHPLMDLIKPTDYLSKLCMDTFAGYAQSQIKKARGLNKKINKPIESRRKSILEFCYVINKNGSIPLINWLAENNLSQEQCGLSNVPHFKDVYLLYHQKQLIDGGWFRGIVSGPEADDLQLSPIPKDIESMAIMNFNKDAYSVYCREYKEYKEWEENRNQLRYQGTLSHGKNYDAKNMMHTFRLLNMAEEIALFQEVRVFREDREFLLNIRAGRFEFEDLIQMVDDKMDSIKELYSKSELPERPNLAKAEKTLIEIRETFYNL